MNKRVFQVIVPVLLIIVSLSFFWKTFVYGLIPVPADTIIGLYHPYRDYYVKDYPHGIPYKNFLITDPVRQQFVWRKLGIETLQQGSLPLRNPYQSAGAPLMANLQSALLYPLNIIFLFVPFTAGWTVLAMLQPIIAVLGMFYYLRKLRLRTEAAILGGIVYAFSGYSIAWLTWNTIGHVAAWLPFVLLIKEHVLHDFIHRSFTRKTWVMLAALVAVESAYWLAGHIQTAVYVWLITDVYLIVRGWQVMSRLPSNERKKYVLKLGIFFGSAFVLVVIATFIQAYTFIQFVFLSSRGTDRANWQEVEGWFLPWKHLIQFVAPDFFGNPATLNYWGTWNYGELVGYVGMVPLLLAVVAMSLRRDTKTFFFSTLGISSLLFALPTVVAKSPYILHVPFLSTVQPTRLLFIVDFSLAVLAALGMDMILRREVSLKQLIRPIGLIGITLAGLWMFTLLWKDDVQNASVAQRNLLLPTGLFVGGSIGIRLIGRIRHIRVRKIGSLLLVSLVCFDLFRFGWKFTPFTDAAYLYPETSAVSFLKKQDGAFRIMSTDNRLLPPNFASYHRIEDIAGYDPLYNKRYGEFVAAWMRGKPDISPFSFNRIIIPQQYDTRFADLLNVRYVLSLSPLTSEKLTPVFQEGQTMIYENTASFDRAFLVSDVVIVPSDQHEIKTLFDKTVDLKKTATAQESITVSNIPLSGTETVYIEKNLPGEIVVKTTTRTPRLLVVTNVYYPYWKATIDGTSVPVHRVDYAFTGVIVPEGDHTVRLFTSL